MHIYTLVCDGGLSLSWSTNRLHNHKGVRMAQKLIPGYPGDGYSAAEREAGIEKLHQYATWGHMLDPGLPEARPGMRMPDPENFVRDTGRVSYPTGQVAVNAAFSPPEGQTATRPGPEQHLG